MDCEAFYDLRDRRTVEYLPGWAPPERTVAVAAGKDAATTPGGQVCLLALANQLARVHRSLAFVLPDGGVKLSVPSPLGGETLGDALRRTCSMIDPCGQFELAPRLPDGALAVGVGQVVDERLDLYIGADAWIGSVDASPLAVTSGPISVWGGAAASLLGTAATFSCLIGHEVIPRRVSAWDWESGPGGATGPREIRSIDVGRVLVVGAGAVGSSLVYWLKTLGVGGSWVVVDGDPVELHNTNRSLLLTPRDAGWPGGRPRDKAEVVASFLPSSEAHVEWYDEWVDTREGSQGFDVLLALANERGVRHQLSQRLPTVMLHATTGSDWMAQLHRHIAGRDDCITCRMGDLPEQVFDCSRGSVPGDDAEPQSDAALPFLSGAAGLMLASALTRLQRGALHEERTNDWRLHFTSPHRFSSKGRRRCSEGCAGWASAEVRRAIGTRGRWAHLDPAHSPGD